MTVDATSGTQQAAAASGPRSMAGFGWALLALFAGVSLARIVYVSLFAEDLPFWDQWDSQLDAVLRPWMDGSFRAETLFELHNEHRVALSRLLTLGLFALNGGQWDNRVEAYFNAGLYAAIHVLLCALLCRHELDRRVRAATLVFALCVGVLPFGWENALVGVESARYLMTLIGIAMIALSVHRPPSTATVLLLCLLGAASLFTIASGLLSCAAVVAAVLLRRWRERLPLHFLVALVVGMGLVSAAGIALIPEHPGAAVLRAVDFAEFARAALMIPMWPLQPLVAPGDWPMALRLMFALVLWAPSLVWLVRFLRSRRADDAELVAGGILAWVLLQAVAIAHSRGHDMPVLPSRYIDVAAIGLLVNGWFAFRFAFRFAFGFAYRPRANAATLPPGNAISGVVPVLASVVLPLAFLSLAAWGLVVRTPGDLREMRLRHQLVLVQKENVVEYLRTGDFAHLQQPRLGIPYRNPKGLRAFLENETIHAMLPPSLRSPLPPAAGRPDATGRPDAKGVGGAIRATPVVSGTLSRAAQRIQDTVRRPFGGAALHAASPVAMDPATIDAARPTPGVCFIDNVNTLAMSDSTNVMNGSVVNLSGWVMRSDRRAPAEFTLVLRGPGAYGFEAPAGAPRRDVARVFGSDAATTVGFSANFRMRDLPKGIYQVLTLVHGPGGNELCDSGRKILIDGVFVARLDPQVLDRARPTASTCVLDAVNGLPSSESMRFASGTAISFSGWVVGSDRSAPARFTLVLRGAKSYGLDSTTGLARPDVAKVLDSDNAANAGFFVGTTLAGVASGTYRVMTLVPGADGDELCDMRRELVVEP